MSTAPNCFLCDNLMLDRDGSVDLLPGIRMAADIAPLRSSHSLIYTVEHFPSSAHLSHGVLRNLVDALDCVRRLPMFSGHDLCFFEHGVQPGRSSIVGCCDHAHVHVLPVRNRSAGTTDNKPLEIDELLDRECEAGRVRRIGSLPLLEVSSLQNQEYCWMGSDLSELRAFSLLRPERQYVRSLAAALAGRGEYKTWDCYDDNSARVTTSKLRVEVEKIRDCIDQQRSSWNSK